MNKIKGLQDFPCKPFIIYSLPNKRQKMNRKDREENH